MASNRIVTWVSGVALLGSVLALPAQAIPIGGVEFPQGAVSFADQVSSYSPAISGGGDPAVPYRGDFNALGVPDYAGSNGCASQAACTFVSLGNGGAIVLQFIDNVLTGSGDAAPDLWIFEIGPAVEDTAVAISVDGITWFEVGEVSGATSGVDIDAFGHGIASAFSFVRLIDDVTEGGPNGDTAGADIDAVGAISTRRVNLVPEPAPLALISLGLAGIAALRRRRI